MSAPGFFAGITSLGKADDMLTSRNWLSRRIEQKRMERMVTINTIHLKLDAWRIERRLICRRINFLSGLNEMIADYAGTQHGAALYEIFAYQGLLFAVITGVKSKRKCHKFKEQIKMMMSRLEYDWPKETPSKSRRIINMIREIIKLSDSRMIVTNMLYELILVIWNDVILPRRRIE
jgi:hypothetical protein